MEVTVEFLGYAAAILTTGAFAPQVARSWRTRSVRDLSPSMIAAMATGNLLWFLYAVGTHAAPLAIGNAITFLLVAILGAMKVREATGARAPAPVAVPAE